MDRLTYFDTELNEEVRVFEPSIEQINSYIERLDNNRFIYFHLVSEEGITTVLGKVLGRVVFKFRGLESKPNFQWGRLIDPAYSDEDGDIEFNTFNLVDIEPLRYTVTEEVAKEVIKYFLEHRRFPSGLEWRGDMSKMTDQS